ncbi:hypothetical protein [Bacillus bombysepticus]|uniref:hypothetical protein n=1 Tax=Bacillus bombysepticus TaxID=658666 RepID=UPI00301B3A97
MKDYKALLEHRQTKFKKIVYGGAHSLALFTSATKSEYPEHKIVKKCVNKFSPVMYYCNGCHSEIRVADKNEHICSASSSGDSSF